MTETELETLRSAANQMPGRAGELLRMALDHADRLQADLRRQLERVGQRGDAVVWQVRNGLVTHGFYRTEKEASKVRFDMQKAHDLGGSLSAFNLRPLYAAPVPPVAPAADACPTASIVSGVVLRDGMPTLIRDKDIHPSDVRLCIASGRVRDAAEMVEPASLPKPQPVFWYRKRSDGGFDGPIPEAAIEDCRRVTWTPLYESLMPGCYWCDQVVKMGDAYHKGLEDGRARAMKLVAEQRGDALLVPRDVLELLEESAIEAHVRDGRDELVCRCCGEVSPYDNERHAEGCAVAVAQRLLAGGGE